jgi:hypothetical protein
MPQVDPDRISRKTPGTPALAWTRARLSLN